MAVLLLKHPVEDYEKWHRAFEDSGALRDRHGCASARPFREAADPDSVLVLLEFAEESQAHRYLEDPELARQMEDAGVLTMPRIEFFED